MSTKRRFSGSEKLRVAVEAIKGDLTLAQISSKYQVHSTQISAWKKQALAYLGEAFSSQRRVLTDNSEERFSELYKQIGQLKVENDFLKKKCDLFSG